MQKFEALSLSLTLDKRVRELLAKMTIEEKFSFLTSHHPAIERLNLPGFGIGGEGAHGLVVRGSGISTVFPQPFGLSMTWNKTLMKKIGGIIGDEARIYFKYKSNRRGMLTLFFPTIDMERNPLWGRNEEAYGEDPFLAGKLAVELIKGAQGEDDYYLKIATTPKHFYANNYEFERTSTDSVISDKRLKFEYYLRVYAYAFEEGKAASMMTAYNKMNGIPGMLHPEMNSIVRGKWGAEGFFVSDGSAFGLVQSDHKAYDTFAESAAAAIKAGLDCFLDRSDLVTEAAKEAYNRGLLTESDIDGALFNQLRILFRLGVYGGNEGNPYENIPESALCSEESAKIARQAACEAVTMLKNDGFLPLTQSAKKIAVIGQLGNENMPDWYSSNPPYQVTPLDGIKKAFPDSEIVFSDGCDTAAFYSETEKTWLRVAEDGAAHFDGTETTRTIFRVLDWGYNGFGFQNCETGKYLTTTFDGELKCDAPAMWGWFVRELFFLNNNKFMPEKSHGTIAAFGVAGRKGTSVYDKPYSNNGVKKINEMLGNISIKIITDGIADAVNTAKGADAAVVVLGNHTLVGARECIDRDTLDLPARWNKLFENVAGENKNTILTVIAGYPYTLEKQEQTARAVIFTTHGAQEVGTAVGETLSGKNNPAGRLSMTWYKTDGDLPDINDYDIIKNKMTYLYCDKPVLHEFGFGLSYTAFEYSDLTLKEQDGGVTVTFSVKNTGKVDGDEVAQVYFTHINAPFTRPLKQLAGFARTRIGAGETKRVCIDVPRKELEYYDIEKDAFAFISGEYKFAVGASSVDLRLEEIIKL